MIRKEPFAQAIETHVTCQVNSGVCSTENIRKVDIILVHKTGIQEWHTDKHTRQAYKNGIQGR